MEFGSNIQFLTVNGGVAQMEERSLCMREVPGSIPGVSNLGLFEQLFFFLRSAPPPPPIQGFSFWFWKCKTVASTGCWLNLQICCKGFLAGSFCAPLLQWLWYSHHHRTWAAFFWVDFCSTGPISIKPAPKGYSTWHKNHCAALFF